MISEACDVVSQVISRQVDGIIISSASFDEEYVQQLIDSGAAMKKLEEFVEFSNKR